MKPISYIYTLHKLPFLTEFPTVEMTYCIYKCIKINTIYEMAISTICKDIEGKTIGKSIFCLFLRTREVKFFSGK